MTKKLLSIKKLLVSVEDKQILNGIDLEVEKGQIHALMGPNGSGKSTLAYALMGHPKYKIIDGTIELLGQNLNDLSPDKRAQLGMFLAMQHPYEIEGVKIKDFLRLAYNSLYDKTDKKLDLKGFRELLQQKMELLNIEPDFVERSINVGFSGGEKKRAEILQMAVLQPKFVILDEIDSGLDVDALTTVCSSINKIRSEDSEIGVLVITHYPRILNFLKPDFVHVMDNGKIIKTGSADLAFEIEREGY
jgi:Fe-S cluster assembly ATP-binding protein